MSRTLVKMKVSGTTFNEIAADLASCATGIST
jgi:hypothetical protein